MSHTCRSSAPARTHSMLPPVPPHWHSPCNHTIMPPASSLRVTHFNVAYVPIFGTSTLNFAACATSVALALQSHNHHQSPRCVSHTSISHTCSSSALAHSILPPVPLQWHSPCNNTITSPASSLRVTHFNLAYVPIFGTRALN